jgi:hypothetical protein
MIAALSADIIDFTKMYLKFTTYFIFVEQLLRTKKNNHLNAI